MMWYECKPGSIDLAQAKDAVAVQSIITHFKDLLLKGP